eukprot:TRINITY_DN6689_c0_g1_i1.p1 TRINITY_DN6689_c0_g1~~TRINITY_DN6689_c0_g1_i1.p1  ORF type:complete len:508 (-),score=85.34 TRINITY_DN6689_c0_g1_i1:110-1633(-)
MASRAGGMRKSKGAGSFAKREAARLRRQQKRTGRARKGAAETPKVSSGSKSLRPSEALARKAYEADDVRRFTVQRALASANIPFGKTRPNVVPDGETGVHGALCGLSVHRQRCFVSGFSRQNPWLTKLLCRFARKENPKFSFTSIQVNLDYAARPHVDRNNLGPSLITGLGNYTNGRLWVHDDEKGRCKFVLGEDIGQNSQYKKGVTFKGRELNIRGQWQEFNGNNLHYTTPFTGTRFSLIYFTCDTYAKTPRKVQRELEELHVNFKWGSEKLEKVLQTRRTERQDLRKTVVKEKFSMHRGVVPSLVDGDCIKYQKTNPKVPGTAAHKRYERYKFASTIADALRRGAENLDLAYDYNQGFYEVVSLVVEPKSWQIEVLDPDMRAAVGSSDKRGKKRKPLKKDTVVYVRVAELHEKHQGIPVSAAALEKLIERVPSFRRYTESHWADPKGPFSKVPLPLLRIALHWADSGRLRYDAQHAAAVWSMLKTWGQGQLASIVNPFASDTASG